MIKAGLIGCGNIGSYYDENQNNDGFYTHAGMYCNNHDFNLIAVCDSNENRVKKAADFWNIKTFYSDFKKMLLNEKFDIISIATPDETHFKIIAHILNTSPPDVIFTEKPVAGSVLEANKIKQLAQKTGTIVIVDYIRRWDKVHTDIKDFLLKGKIGTIQVINGYYVRGIKHNGCQMINLIHFIFGKIISVQAIDNKTLNHGNPGYKPREDKQPGSVPDDPSLNLRMELANGNTATITALDRKGYSFSIFELDIIGTKGRIRLLDGGRKIEYYTLSPDPQFPNFNSLSLTSPPWEDCTYNYAMENAGIQIAEIFKKNFNKKKWTTENSISESINDLAIIESGLESHLNNNKTINIEFE